MDRQWSDIPLSLFRFLKILWFQSQILRSAFARRHASLPTSCCGTSRSVVRRNRTFSHEFDCRPIKFHFRLRSGFCRRNVGRHRNGQWRFVFHGNSGHVGEKRGRCGSRRIVHASFVASFPRFQPSLQDGLWLFYCTGPEADGQLDGAHHALLFANVDSHFDGLCSRILNFGSVGQSFLPFRPWSASMGPATSTGRKRVSRSPIVDHLLAFRRYYSAYRLQIRLDFVLDPTLLYSAHRYFPATRGESTKEGDVHRFLQKCSTQLHGSVSPTTRPAAGHVPQYEPHALVAGHGQLGNGFVAGQLAIRSRRE